MVRIEKMEDCVQKLICFSCKRYFLPKIKPDGKISSVKRCPYRDCRSTRWDGRDDLRTKPNGRKKHLNELKKKEVKYRCTTCNKKRTRTKSIEKVNDKTISFCYCYNCKKDFEIVWAVI